jgi:acetyl-CoA carboxylase biotin carboxylase subunit
MGDKIEAKRTATRLGIPVVPGSEGGVGSDQEAIAVARSIGFPLLVKASAGGGGRGMKVARSADDLSNALATARAEAKAAFGDDAVYLEKYLERPRHIEIQVLGDGQGHAIHLGERDCSRSAATRRSGRKASSPRSTSPPATPRRRSRAMRELEYLGVGTVEFHEEGKFYFIEMNTRIQVEHW